MTAELSGRWRTVFNAINLWCGMATEKSVRLFNGSYYDNEPDAVSGVCLNIGLTF